MNKSKGIRVGLLLVSICLILLMNGCNQKNKLIRHRLIYNCDGNKPLSCSSVAEINEYVDRYANSQVTTFMVCSGSDFFHYRSKYGKVFCGEKNYLKLEKEGADMLSTTLRRAKHNNMEAFITYRVNDIHFTDTSMVHTIENSVSDFWREHPEFWVNENVGWHSRGAFDFAHKEVRERKLAIIKEQLDKYGALLDGYDLDFMRFIVYFKSNEAEKNAPLITELVKAVKAEVDKQSEKYGKKILLSVRVPTSIDDCLSKGLDITEWVNLGLVDFVSIGVHFTGNPAMPVAKFKSDLGSPETPVYASIDDGGYQPREIYSHGMYRGMASHILAQGGNGIYLFNHFFTKPLSLEEGGQVSRVIVPELIQEIGSLETLRKRNKIYCQDDGKEQYQLIPETPLPLTIQSEDKKALAHIFIGDDIKKEQPEEAVMFIRSNKPINSTIWVNGIKAEIQKTEYVDLFNRGNNLTKDETVYAFVLPVSCLRQGNNEVSFQSTNHEESIIKRLEIALKYGDVETHGYF